MATGLMTILRHQVLRKTVYGVLKSCNKEYQIRFLSDQKVHYVEELKERGLIQVSGNDASQFLQGLITNDMKHLDEGSRSMYTMFLNTKGRVMYDAILYKNLQKPGIFIECDKAAVNDLQKHLKMFKIRRKVELNLMNNYKVWVIFSPDYAEEITKENELRVTDISQEKVVPCQAVDFQSTIEFDNEIFNSLMDENLIVSWDPRLPMLGVRLVAEDSVDIELLAKEKGISIEKPAMSYKSFRYKLGIGEGITELPYGNCFPLEMNCDYLHGVSFHKGCYIGQELTARTHHTGVVRKRLMPIFLDTSVEDRSDYKIDTQIEVSGETGRAIGKLRGVEKNTAIGLVRISEALSATKLKIGSLTGYTVKPRWWPHEAPKGSLSLRKE